MTFYKYIFSPRLFKEYGDSQQKMYEPGAFEKYGEQFITALNLMWSFSYYSSPLIITFLYRRGYFVAESVGSLAKFTTGIGILVMVSLCMRGFGRSQNNVYKKFAKILEEAKTDGKNDSLKKQLRLYDFEFEDWPVDFAVKRMCVRKNVTSRSKPLWISSLPCQIVAYCAIHSFGIRMIYPGSVKLLQNFIQPTLLQGREKMVKENDGKRYKVKTCDNNEIDTMFIDNRGRGGNGKTLVLCSEGNAGFYEIGIMGTPIELNYSVLGWNHPGFAGSSGRPYPYEDQNAIDAVVQFAIELGFLPENIILYGWSIGGYSTLWAASQYPEIKGVVLDATFDDVLQLALPRMPECISNIVKIAIRDYVNLNNTELMNQYNGPVLLIRRTEDEIICSEDNVLGTNRGNYLLLHVLKTRFPNIFKTEQILLAQEMLANPITNFDILSVDESFLSTLKATIDQSVSDSKIDEVAISLLKTYLSKNGNSRKFPIEIGAEITNEQRSTMARFLVKKHLLDYKSTHCTPLPGEYFQHPWDIEQIN